MAQKKGRLSSEAAQVREEAKRMIALR